MKNNYKDKMLNNINYYFNYLYYHFLYNKEIICDIQKYN
jgi:hypothetical protein